MTEKPIMEIVEAIDAYLGPDAPYVFLESEATELCILWQALKAMIGKEAKDIPIDRIRHCLDGAARDNTFYQWLLDACDIIEDLRIEIEARKK